jgi:cobalt/nickel transport system permease protein
VPRLTEQILLTWRFIFILLGGAAIHRAQTLRFGYRTLPLGYRSLAMLVGLYLPACCCATRDGTTLDIKLYQGDFHL